MKNNSVKFKQNVPKSSTTSIISEFSYDESPTPNGFQFQSFTHAQTISAKLNKNSVYNPQNIMFNTPRRLAVPFQEIEKDEVLSKTPVNKQLFEGTKQFNSGQIEPVSFSEALIKQSKYTEESLKKIQKLEKFLEKTKQKYYKPINILSSDESPCKPIAPSQISGLASKYEGSEQKLDSKVNKKFNQLMDELRIIRKNIQYFTAFDGAYAQSQKTQNNFISLKQQNGIIINNGNHMTRLELINDTFKSEKICDINEKDSKFISFCISDKNISNDMLITGSDRGNIMGWNLFKNQAYHYYGLNNQYNCNLQNHSLPTFITQSFKNIYVGTKNNELLILDERMNERQCLSLTIQNSYENVIQANSILSPLLPRFGSSIVESPEINPIDPNLLNETNFRLDEEYDSIKGDLIEEFPSFEQLKDLNRQESQQIKYIDVNDYNVLVTMTDGFIHLDMRNPTVAQFSFQQNYQQALKAMFCPGNSNNIIYAKQNSNKCLLWNLQKNEVLFHKELQNNPLDMIVSQETKEILFLHQEQNDSIIKVYNNVTSKLKYCDELIIPNFHIQKILLDYQCDTLYGIGPYSLRTWNYFQQKEIDLIHEEMQNQLESLI
ncbi:unnamed protein product [Paramecium primaurelia]|uniref:Uncharacterized protein n=1 Tax=Paramecium primaurelia TaxID=5886 RepID=A0A8S1M1H4_PARPR|nr:unnamed protein product [Paramecium primaurelia]